LFVGVLLVVQVACGRETADDLPDDGLAMAPATAATRLSGLLGSQDNDRFARALQPREFEFPTDHGAHPAFRNEWWYLSGNLDGEEDGRRFGFEFTLFRFSLSPEPTPVDSAWRTKQVYIGHLAVTDVNGETFYAAERYSRGALGLAGAETSPLRIWLEDWQMAAAPSADTSLGPRAFPWRVSAGDEAFGIELTVDPLKPPVLNGDEGLSKKSAQPGNASYYYSMTRLATEGKVRIGTQSYAVKGLSWLDREWSSSALSADQSGWDWFALQLDSGRELMFYQLRKLDGTTDANSGGTYVREDGATVGLSAEDVSLKVLDYWTNPEGDRYPSEWRLQVPSQAIDVRILPVMQAQELDTLVRYWEGAVDVVERDGGAGRGYVELTGYAKTP